MSAWPRLGDPRRNRESKAALTCAWEACLASDCGSRCSFGSILAIAKFARHTPPPLSAPGAPSPLHTFREAPLAPICAVFASRSPLSALLSPGTPCAALPGSSSCARTSMRSDLAPRDVRRPQEEAAPSTHDLEAAMFGGNGFGGAADWSEMVEHHEQEQAFGGLQAPGIADAGVSESEEESDSESESEGSDSGWQAHAEPPSTSSGQGQDDGKAKRAPVPVQQLSKKERKAKELEDLEQTLAELGIELKSGDASGAGAGAGAGAGEKKKKKKKKGDSRGASAQEAPPAAEPEPAATTGTADENGHIEVDPEAAKKALAAKASKKGGLTKKEANNAIAAAAAKAKAAKASKGKVPDKKTISQAPKF